MSQQNVTVKISERQKQILSANFGLFLYKKPRKRPVLQAVTSFFAGDVFEDEGFLVFVQGFELFFLVDDGRVMFQLSKNEVEILRTKISSTNYSAKSRSLPRETKESDKKFPAPKSRDFRYDNLALDSIASLRLQNDNQAYFFS